jgi:PAS domain S-box-containing protein
VEGVLGVDFDAANFMHNIVVAKWRVIGFMALMQMVLLGSGTVTSLLRAEAGERKRAYAELRGSEEQFRAMFETASIGMAQADPRTGQWVRVNQRLCVISGYSADELLRLHFSEITHPDDRQADWDAFQRVVRGEAPDYQMEKRYIRKDGTIAWVNVNMAIVRDAAGQPVRTMSTIEDIMERRQTEETLRTLSRAVEQSPASIVITDTCGNIEYANPKFTEVTGYTIDEARWKNPRILKSGETPPEEYARLWQSITQGQEWHGEFHNKKKNGDLYWESATISPILDATGCTTHFVAVKEDITERKNAEAELAGVERKLRAAFRQAGMAEVATSVLHNVGNVLNSVNVSLGIATEKAGQMKAASIVRIAALLREHADDLPAFFANHPQGARLPQFLEQLAGHFAADQQSVLGELYSLRTNIEHINEIVAMQQSYAGAGGVIEVLPLADVVEDALRMNLAAFDRHGTNVVREFDSALPPVAVDRNKVLLILVNVVRNAKYACDEAGRGDKRITVRTHLNGDGIARISVSDNGVGIPPGNLTRIFEHGFTTRKGGHGFGLHSSALAAAEMGGSLRAESDGTGTGATFTLELPVSPDHT